MIEIRTQKDLRQAQKIQFCCICGRPFDVNEKRTRQHVPPKAIFADCDRNSPLIVPAHASCNSDQSPLDTVIGQLVATLHQKYPAARDVKLDVEMFRLESGRSTAGVKDLPLQRIIFRWVRCFHAALYNEFLVDRGGYLHHPFPAGDVVNGKLVYNQIPECRAHLTETFKQQVKAGRTDSVICNNGKCEYRCTWMRADPPKEHHTICLFALRLYNWEELGDPRFPRMGCLGYYDSEIPPSATCATDIRIPVSNLEPLDPFAP